MELITEEILSKIIQFGACHSTPPIGTPINKIPLNDLFWAESVGLVKKGFALANSGDVYGDSYGDGRLLKIIWGIEKV